MYTILDGLEYHDIMVMGQITVRQILDFTLYERKLVIACRVCRLTAHVELYLLKNNELLERKFTKIQRRLQMTLSPHTNI
ncbi:19580_t:CDS:2 [Rhizophagus irregularis]|nr:19580_t:CDS:2 [Rhizophagus irregularis]